MPLMEFKKNLTIAAPLKYLSNFCRSLETPLINWKVELKVKWTKYCVLSAAGNDNGNDNDDNGKKIFYYQRHKITCSCCKFISKR